MDLHPVETIQRWRYIIPLRKKFKNYTKNKGRFGSGYHEKYRDKNDSDKYD